MRILIDKLCQFIRESLETTRECVLSSVQSDGSVMGVDYRDSARGTSWTPRIHLGMMMGICPNYPDVAEKMLDFWLKTDSVSSNWWWPQIGTPIALCSVMLMLKRPLVRGSIEWSILSRSKMGMTGQNKVWLAEIHLMKGLLCQDELMVQEGRDAILSEIEIREGEGLQEDWSFQQHGAQLQFGNYGLHWFENMVKWMIVFSGTKYAFPQEKSSLIETFYRHGLRWTLTSHIMDVNACGRQFGCTVPNAPSLEEEKSLRVDKCLTALKKNGYLKNAEPSPIGCKAYPRSGYLVNRRKDFVFSVRMCSRSLMGAETCNSENMQGLYAGDGGVHLYPNGRRWDPREVGLRDWRKVPGTTELQDESSLVPTGTSHNAEGACCCCAEGEYGAAMMRFQNENLVAEKAYFVLGDCIVCMGTGIASDSQYDVVTTLLQTVRAGGDVRWQNESLPEGEHVFRGPGVLTVGGMKVILLEEGEYHVLLDDRHGDWKAIHFEVPSIPMESPMVTVWQSHGNHPVNGSYAYMMMPDSCVVPAYQLIREPHIIGIRTEDCTQLAFFAPGKVGSYESDAPMLMMDIKGAMTRIPLR